MGTYFTVKAYGASPGLLDRVFMEAERISEKYSLEKEGSYISRLNRGEVSLDEETRWLLDFARGLWEASDGAFDPTVGRLKILWGFNKKLHLPSPEAIKEALKFVSFGRVKFVEGKLQSTGFVLDLSSFAKGYAVDRACEILMKNGINSALVDAGGDIRVIGEKPDGTPWRIGIKNPSGPGIIKVLSLRNSAVATSGDYENFFVKDGVKYHHLLDPRTGYPARWFKSVSVVADTCMMADALATAIFVAGPEKGREMAEKYHVMVFVVGQKGNLRELSGR